MIEVIVPLMIYEEMFRKIGLISFLLLLPGLPVVAQNTGNGCPNADFSSGNFSGWTGYTGYPTSPSGGSSTFTPGIVTGRHTIIDSAYVDSNTCGGLLTLPPGYINGVTNVARLGNDSLGGAEKLVYTLSVDSSNALFSIQYAVVLKSTGGLTYLQIPRFIIQVRDTANQFISSCYGRTLVPNLIPNQCGAVKWQDWTHMAFDFSAFIGTSINIEFTTYDAYSTSGGLGFGYAYITTQCHPLFPEIDICGGDSSLLLVAPPGFTAYSWNTTPVTNNDSLLFSNQNIGDTLVLTLTPLSQFCSTQVRIPINAPILNAGFYVDAPCANQAVFHDTSTVQNGMIKSWLWNFSNGSTSTQQHPTHTFPGPGQYTVTLIVYSDTSHTGCSDTLSSVISIFPDPSAGFSYNLGCLNEISQFTDTSNSNGVVSWNWNFGNNVIPSFSASQNPSVIFTNSGPQNVSLVITDTVGCTDSVGATVNVNNFVKAGISLNDTCDGNSIIFTDTSQIAVNDSVVYREWDMGDGSSYSNSSMISHTYANHGQFQVTLVVQTSNGCSDTVIETVNVFPVPSASFSSIDECYQDSVRFYDSSFVAAPSTISSWTWDLGDGNMSSSKDPVHQYSSPGVFPVTLTITTSEGCSSTVSDTVKAFDYPDAGFIVSLNCVGTTSQFTDTSLANDPNGITAWSWTFGGSATPATSSTQNPVVTFNSPGTGNASLVITNANGCSDTVTTAFTAINFPLTDFSFTSQCIGVPISFVDLTQTTAQDSIVSWTWDMGDGTTYNGTGV